MVLMCRNACHSNGNGAQAFCEPLEAHRGGDTRMALVRGHVHRKRRLGQSCHGVATAPEAHHQRRPPAGRHPGGGGSTARPDCPHSRPARGHQARHRCGAGLGPRGGAGAYGRAGLWFDLNHGAFPPDNVAQIPRSLCQYSTRAQTGLPHNVAWPFCPFFPCCGCHVSAAMICGRKGRMPPALAAILKKRVLPDNVAPQIFPQIFLGADTKICRTC